MKVPPLEECDSYVSRVVDAAGNTYLHTVGTNSPGAAEASRKHARWWMARQRRPGAHKDWTANPWRQPCAPLKFEIEFFNQASGRNGFLRNS